MNRLVNLCAQVGGNSYVRKGTYLIGSSVAVYHLHNKFKYPTHIKYASSCNVNEVIYSYLKHDIYFKDQDITDKPNFEDKRQNAERYRRMLGSRRFIWSELPPDTKWYKCKMLFDHNSDYVLQVWPHPECVKIENQTDSKLLDGTIFFGHDFSKLMILEGNHRYSQWKATGTKGVAEVYVGISPSNFCKYPGDYNDIK